MARKIALLFLAALVVLEPGCTKPYIQATPSEKVRSSLGTIGVISIRSLPDFNYYTPHPKGKITGGFKGAGKGIANTFLVFGHMGQCEGLGCVAILTVLVAALPVAAVVGGVHGAVTAVSEKDIEEARESLGVALHSLGIQQAMRDRFISIARQKTERKIADVNEMIFFAGDEEKPPVDEGEMIKASSLKEAGFDSVIIYEATAMRLNTLRDEKNPPLFFSIDAKARILKSNGTLLYVSDFACKGEERRFTEWAAKDCSLFKEALERCYDDIAKQAVERLFMSNDIKRDGRFIAYENGTVLDTKTNLMWAAWDNGYNVNWSEAKSYCENYRGGGYTDWRMPTQDELEGLFDSDNPKYQACNPSQKIYLTNLIYLSCCCPWASDTSGAEAAGFNFSYGSRYWLHQSNGSYHALPVRSVK